MTAHQLKTPIPPLSLEAGMTITVEAIDPASGANVAGVTVSSFTVYATNDTPQFVATGDDPLPVYVPVGDEGGP